MFTMIGITGESGTGKSTSLRNMDPETTWIASRIQKGLPFLSTKWIPNKNHFVLKSHEQFGRLIKAAAKAEHVQTLVIDDWQYTGAYELFDRVDEKGYEKWNELAAIQANYMRLMEAVMRPDQYGVWINHDRIEEVNGIQVHRIKTQGKMVDDKLNPEGLMSVHLFTELLDNYEQDTIEFKFRVRANRAMKAKVPFEMYDPATQHIDNDLAEFIADHQAYMKGQFHLGKPAETPTKSEATKPNKKKAG